jgi:hypothetical protein
MIDHVPYGVRAMSALVESFHNNVGLNTSINTESAEAASQRRTLITFAFDGVMRYGRVADLYSLLSNVCADDVDLEIGTTTTRYEMICQEVMARLTKNNAENNASDENPSRILLPLRLRNDRLEVNAQRMKEPDVPGNWLTVDRLEREDFDLTEYLSKLACLEEGQTIPRPKPSLQVLHSNLELLCTISTEKNIVTLQEFVDFETVRACACAPVLLYASVSCSLTVLLYVPVCVCVCVCCVCALLFVL